MGATDWKSQASKLQRLLGFKLYETPGPKPVSDFDASMSEVPETDIGFEVMSPNTPDSFVQKFLDESGPGLHHIAIEVDDIHKAASDLEALGLTPFGGVDDDGAWHVTYIHPREGGGVLYQIFQPHVVKKGADRSTPDRGVAKVVRADHVSVATRDIEKQIAFQEQVLGMKTASRWEDQKLGYLGAVMEIPYSKLRFELMQATRSDSFVQQYIDASRPGMHHICLQVESVEGAVEGLRSEGIEAFGGIVESDWRRHTFLHPKDSGGVLFQLFEE